MSIVPPGRRRLERVSVYAMPGVETPLPTWPGTLPCCRLCLPDAAAVPGRGQVLQHRAHIHRQVSVLLVTVLFTYRQVGIAKWVVAG